MQNVHRLWYEASLTQKIKFRETVFSKGVICDYKSFGTTEIAGIYELNQAISKKKNQRWYPREELPRLRVVTRRVKPLSPRNTAGRSVFTRPSLRPLFENARTFFERN